MFGKIEGINNRRALHSNRCSYLKNNLKENIEKDKIEESDWKAIKLQVQNKLWEMDYGFEEFVKVSKEETEQLHYSQYAYAFEINPGSHNNPTLYIFDGNLQLVIRSDEKLMLKKIFHSEYDAINFMMKSGLITHPLQLDENKVELTEQNVTTAVQRLKDERFANDPQRKVFTHLITFLATCSDAEARRVIKYLGDCMSNYEMKLPAITSEPSQASEVV